MNKTLLQGLKTRLNRTRGSWVDELYHVLWAYRMTQKISIGETPFNLIFRIKVVIPVKIGLSFLRIEEYNEDSNSKWLRTNLDLVEESRERATVRMASYQ